MTVVPAPRLTNQNDWGIKPRRTDVHERVPIQSHAESYLCRSRREDRLHGTAKTLRGEGADRCVGCYWNGSAGRLLLGQFKSKEISVIPHISNVMQHRAIKACVPRLCGGSGLRLELKLCLKGLASQMSLSQSFSECAALRPCEMSWSLGLKTW